MSEVPLLQISLNEHQSSVFQWHFSGEMTFEASYLRRNHLGEIQGYLAHKRQRPPHTLQPDYA